MTERFADLFSESLNTIDMTPGAVVTGVVVDIAQERVIVHAGLKSEGVIPKSQFADGKGEVHLSIGDPVQVVMEVVDDGYGETHMSREKARRLEVWEELESALEHGRNVEGVIADKVKGGYIVYIDTVRAFLPGSLIDVRPLYELDISDDTLREFKIIKLDRSRNNIVLSRRAVLEAETSLEAQKLLDSLEEGQEISGTVKNLTDYGAFVDLGGIDGLLHITDMAWSRIRHPSDLVELGQELKVKVLRFDPAQKRVSLGLKQMDEDPWTEVANRYPVGQQFKARVTNITEYGCFAELERGIEGLVHVSEMAWTKKNIDPASMVSVDDEIDVMVLSLEEDRRRISLGMRQCQENPWEQFLAQYPSGSRLRRPINAITDFGIFVSLGDGMDGLVHMSNIAWDEPGEEVVKKYTKGQEIEVVVLTVDTNRERVSLGIKQLEEDAFSSFLKDKGRGSRVTGTVIKREEKTATLRLIDEVEGFLRAADADSRETVDDLRTYLEDGQEIEAMISKIDHKKRVVWLSVKMLQLKEESSALESHRRDVQEEPVVGTIGDLIIEEQKKKQAAAKSTQAEKEQVKAAPSSKTAGNKEAAEDNKEAVPEKTASASETSQATDTTPSSKKADNKEAVPEKTASASETSQATDTTEADSNDKSASVDAHETR